ncbi:excitatory amino acid transporter 2-like isoform X2 [Xenia sp. Carnegie-2017]|nr:excitatory amino acid transporter 2-like isoform X2 [Xenia sp. Carnegie-2017]
MARFSTRQPQNNSRSVSVSLSRKYGAKVACSWFRQNLLLFIVIGVAAGFIIGLTVNDAVQHSKDPSPKELTMYIAFAGEIFLRMLMMIILPLITSSIIVAVAVLDSKSTGKLGKRALIYYLSTTLLAVVVGIILVSSIKPGEKASTRKPKEQAHAEAVHSILDLVRNCFPDNIVGAAFQSTSTKFIKKHKGFEFVNKTSDNYKNSLKNLTELLKDEFVNPWSVSNEKSEFQVIKKSGSYYEYDGLEKKDRLNILGVLVFSIMFGVVLSKMGEQGKLMTEWFTVLLEVTMKLVEIIMWFSPIGICSLIAGKLAGMENIKDNLEGLGMYMMTVIVGLFIHAFITLPIIYIVVVRKNPIPVFFGMSNAFLTAFGTSSSAATMPVTIKCLEKNNNVDPRIVRFVIPIGTTVNMDGTALYEAVAPIFLAQRYYGGSVDLGKTFLV